MLQDVSRPVAWSSLWVPWKRSRSFCSTGVNRDGGWELRIGRLAQRFPCSGGTGTPSHCTEVGGFSWQGGAGRQLKAEDAGGSCISSSSSWSKSPGAMRGPSPRKQLPHGLPVLRTLQDIQPQIPQQDEGGQGVLSKGFELPIPPEQQKPYGSDPRALSLLVPLQ